MILIMKTKTLNWTPKKTKNKIALREIFVGLRSMRLVGTPQVNRKLMKQQLLIKKVKEIKSKLYQASFRARTKHVKSMKIKKETMNTLKYVELMTWNANGIHYKRNELEKLLYRDRIDIFLITETKLSKNEIIKFINYNCYRRDRIAENSGVGVMILVDKKFNDGEKMMKFDETNADRSMEYIAMKLNEIIYLAVYVAPEIKINVNDLEKLFELGSGVIMSDDFNAKHQAWGNVNNNSSGGTLSNYLIISSNCGVNMRFSYEHTHYTVDRAQGTTIDLFSIKTANYSKTYTRNELTSDHLPVIMQVNSNKTNNSNDNNFEMRKFDYNKTDWNK